MKNSIFWIMGPTSSGKTTLASSFFAELKKEKIPVIHYDGDEVRDFFGDNIGFKKEDRLRVVKTIVYLANKALDSGLSVIVSALTANQDARDYIKKNVRKLKIVFLDCSLDTCIERDPKGLYTKALKGEIKTVIGYNTEYKSLSDPDIRINSESESIKVNVEKLIEFSRVS